MNDQFSQWRETDILDLIAAYPFAWIVSAGRPELALQMPVIAEQGTAPGHFSLLGHLPRRHPLVPAVETGGRAWFMFQGPHRYISPDWAGESGWAPTWNFASARVEAKLSLDDALTDRALERLCRHMESAAENPWSIQAMGARYASLKSKVIGFRAEVRSVHGRFKLGQDESPATFRAIVAALGDDPLAQWMLRFGQESRAADSTKPIQ